MNIALTPRHRRYITTKVKQGDYGSPDEVVRQGLRLLEAEDERRQRIQWLRAEVAKGFAGSASPWTSKDAGRIRKLIAERANKQ
jgi:putative addiction module CopG family antidote